MRWLAAGLVACALACSPEEALPPGCPEVAVPEGVYESEAGGTLQVEGDILTLTRGPTVTRYRIGEYGRYTSRHMPCGARPAGHGLRTIELLPGATTTHAVVRVAAAAGGRLVDPVATSSIAEVAAPSVPPQKFDHRPATSLARFTAARIVSALFVQTNGLA